MTDKTNQNDEEDSKPSSRDDPEAIFRIYSVLSYIVVLVIIGLPIWWFTTRVYRANLPLTEMNDIVLPNKTDKPYGIPLSLEYDILVTMVNPEPQNIQIDFNGEVIEHTLQPFLSSINSVAAFVVKTQWVYLTNLGINPKKIKDHFAIHKEQLPHIITPLEKRLWSQMSPRPSINLVLYFTSCDTPLYIYDSNDQIAKTNAFLSPRWGGVLILNANKESCDTRIYKPDIQYIASTFIKQLRELLQIDIEDKNYIEKFKIERAMEMVDSSRRTLKSLAQLLSEISSIVISDDVASKIQIALDSSNKAEEYLMKGEIENALEVAKIGFNNSEAAFSDPSLLALLYFPDDQKYAVYIPLYLPMMIPVVMSVFILKRLCSNIQKNKLKVE